MDICNYLYHYQNIHMTKGYIRKQTLVTVFLRARSRLKAGSAETEDLPRPAGGKSSEGRAGWVLGGGVGGRDGRLSTISIYSSTFWSSHIFTAIPPPPT